MSVLGDSHKGIVPATVVYVYTSNAICSLFHEFLSTVQGLTKCSDKHNNNSRLWQFTYTMSFSFSHLRRPAILVAIVNALCLSIKKPVTHSVTPFIRFKSLIKSSDWL